VETNASLQMTLVISNTGNSTLTINSINYPSGFSGDFPSGTIAAGATQNVVVTFAPTDTIAYGGTVTVECDATAGTNTVSVSGTGIPSGTATRIISLSGDLDFGDLEVGSNAQLT